MTTVAADAVQARDVAIIEPVPVWTPPLDGEGAGARALRMASSYAAARPAALARLEQIEHDAEEAIMPTAEAITEVRTLIARIGDPAERALVTEILAARTEHRPVPSWSVMSPLMRVADLTLRGVI